MLLGVKRTRVGVRRSFVSAFKTGESVLRVGGNSDAPLVVSLVFGAWWAIVGIPVAEEPNENGSPLLVAEDSMSQEFLPPPS
jgi:hypothetical protein